MSPVFTVAEVARLLEAVDGREALTPRAIRYAARTGMVAPTGQLTLPKKRNGSHKKEKEKGSRLYTVVDIAMLRLAWLLRHKFSMTERGVWAVLMLQSAAIRQQLLTGAGAVTFDNPVPFLARGTEDQRWREKERDRRLESFDVPIRIPLTLVVPPQLLREAQALRQETPEIWTGIAWMSAADAAAQVTA